MLILVLIDDVLLDIIVLIDVCVVLIEAPHIIFSFPLLIAVALSVSCSRLVMLVQRGNWLQYRFFSDSMLGT